ncbi:MAG: DNA-binding protein [Clostridium sp.]|jgi:predicted DNA-binding protein with PD1-like motif|uniref:PPC domain-containing DNA-binding protein n=1 Tax=Clostridium sp. TaxID=1506 RepID=UPI0025BCE225|nr:PPC domain-containing DNA-binding protein [Clostridium sp.]MCH3965096.1 DNA-binding protein [Clostridium sp.]MCI1714317.1 DNA-binding protein [Clostridium sp.]MCI1798579.1 DNA-binding protein [Clostridium sp.]MCI1812690.1 DNA-binding protein [Clostridium sp.]MCI1869388.1 DNA-binding protein [Clostridium sp.]
MKFRKSGSTYIVKLNKGEEVIEELSELCREQNIKAGYFTAIGAAGEVKLGYFDPVKKVYDSRDIVENLEITSLVGNIGRLENDDVVIHSHINLSNKNYGLIGGHLFKCRISLVCEIFITDLGEKIKKSPDREFGLNFMDL